MRFSLLFFALLLGDLIAKQYQTEMPYLEYFFKPALMVSLGVYFFQQTNGLKTGKMDKYIMAAIIFSLLGDILLMYEGQFIVGLVAFLTAHICYIVAFLADTKALDLTNKDRLWAEIVIMFFAGFFLTYLLPYLGSLKIPVSIYAFTITTMLLTVLNRWKSVRLESFQWVMAGATLFVVSDGILAVNRFATPFSLANILVMLTYGVGQYLIIVGYLKNK